MARRPCGLALLAFVLAGALASGGCSSLQTTLQRSRKSAALDRLRQGAIEGNHYKNDYYQFEVSGPEGWQVKQFKKEALVTFLSPDDITEIDVAVAPVPATASAMAAGESEDQQPPEVKVIDRVLRQRIKPDHTVTRRRAMVLDGRPAVELIVEGTWKDEPMTTWMVGAQYKSYVYILETLTATALFDRVVESFDSVVRSFRFTAEEQPLGRGIASGDYFTYQVKPGESLETLADRFLGSRQRSWVLAHVNDTEDVQPWTYIIVPRYLTHIVRSGQDLAAISEYYYGDQDHVEALKAYNDVESVRLGDEIFVPLYETYEVQPGDTLESLGERFFLDRRAGTLLAEYNRLAGRVFPGQTLKVPLRRSLKRSQSAVDYRVRPGDTLATIAVDQTGELDNWKILADFNDIRAPYELEVGQVIRIPRDLVVNKGEVESRPAARRRRAPAKEGEPEQTPPVSEQSPLYEPE